MQKKAEKPTKQAQAIALKTQKRQCDFYRVLLRSGKAQGKITTAIARESSGLVWAIACAVTGQAEETATKGVNQHAYIRLIHRRFKLRAP